MLHDRRRFFGVAFYSPPLKKLSNLKKLWPTILIHKSDKIIEPNGKYEIEHLIYYSKKRYTVSPELDDYSVSLNNATYYEYSLYLLGFELGNKFVILISAPFSLLLKDVFDHIQQKVSGKDIVYQQVKLNELIYAIEANNNLGGNIKLTLVEMTIEGDNANRFLSLRGPNVIHSKTFLTLRNTLNEFGLTLTPRKCRLLYNDHEGSKFSLITDQFGNFGFHVGKDGRNLPYSLNLFSYLFAELLVKETYTFPPVREFEEQTVGETNE